MRAGHLHVDLCALPLQRFGLAGLLNAVASFSESKILSELKS